MEWISVKDQEPPKDGTPFLCYDPNPYTPEGKIYVIIYDSYNAKRGYAQWREASGECYFPWNPTHWMPLPKPPKEFEEKNDEKSCS